MTTKMYGRIVSTTKQQTTLKRTCKKPLKFDPFDVSRDIFRIKLFYFFSLVVTLDTYSCMDPGIPVNGMRFSHDLSIGSTVSFQCDTGYRLSHDEPLVCEKNHFWSHPLPTCDGTYAK